jgi:hypothetical protein
MASIESWWAMAISVWWGQMLLVAAASGVVVLVLVHVFGWHWSEGPFNAGDPGDSGGGGGCDGGD